jgi:hypothetical protein
MYSAEPLWRAGVEPKRRQDASLRKRLEHAPRERLLGEGCHGLERPSSSVLVALSIGVAGSGASHRQLSQSISVDQRHVQDELRVPRYSFGYAQRLVGLAVDLVKLDLALQTRGKLDPGWKENRLPC